MAALLLVERRQIVQGLAEIGMRRRERSFANGQRASEQRLGVGKTLLPLIKGREIVQCGRHFDRVEAAGLLEDRQCALVEWLSLGVLSGAAIEHAEVVEGCCDIAVHRAMGLFHVRQQFLRQRNGL